VEPELARLVAQREIEDVILRYCRGIDRMDRELVRSCYHADASDEHGSFSGGVDAFLDWVWKLLARYESTMHFIGNVLIELRGERAAAETYGVSFHRGPEASPHLNLITGFRFLDRFERRGGGPWKIASRVAVTEWSRRDDAAGRWPVPGEMRSGRRDRSDALYSLLADIAREPR
jgi:SnoaL-like domain